MDEQRKKAIRNYIPRAYLFAGLSLVWSSFRMFMFAQNTTQETDILPFSLPFGTPLMLGATIVFCLGIGFLISYWGYRGRKTWSKPLSLIVGIIFITWAILVGYQNFADGKTIVAIISVFIALFYLQLIYFLWRE